MSIAIEFQYPPGTILDTRRFEPGQSLRVVAKIQNWDGLPGGLLHTILEIYPPKNEFTSIYDEDTSNLWGHAIYDIVLPNVLSKATLRITVDWTIGGPEIKTLPIGIGVDPAPITYPKAINWYMVAAAGVTVIGAVMVANAFKK